MIRRTHMTDRTLRTAADLDSLSFWENGLLPVVAQNVENDAVLMVAFANREALEKTLDTCQMHYWSRSRQELWHKGATSGNYQDLVSLHADCDGDTLLARVRQLGPACHTGESTCFGITDPELLAMAPSAPDTGNGGTEDTIPGLWAVLQDRLDRRPTNSYTVELLDDENLRLKKLGEETAELILALARDEKTKIPQEAADLVYHLMVALLASGTTLDDLLAELDTRKA